MSGDTAAPDSGKKKVADMSKYHQLTQEERYSITALRVSGNSQAEIARVLGKLCTTPHLLCIQ